MNVIKIHIKRRKKIDDFIISNRYINFQWLPLLHLVL